MSDCSRLRDFCRDLAAMIEEYAGSKAEDPALPMLKRIAKKAGQLQRFANTLIDEANP